MRPIGGRGDSDTGTQSCAEQVAGISGSADPSGKMLGRCIDALLAVNWLSLLPKVACFSSPGRGGREYLQLAAGPQPRPAGNDVRQIRFGRCLCGLAAATSSPFMPPVSTNGMNCPVRRYGAASATTTSHPDIGHLLGVLVFYRPGLNKPSSPTSCSAAPGVGTGDPSCDRRSANSRRHQPRVELPNRSAEPTRYRRCHRLARRHNISDKVLRHPVAIRGMSCWGQNHRSSSPAIRGAEVLRADVAHHFQQERSGTAGICNRRKRRLSVWVRSTIAPFLDEHGE